MSVQKRGSSYVVRWREGGRQLSRSFTRRGDAVAFETDVGAAISSARSRRWWSSRG